MVNKIVEIPEHLTRWMRMSSIFYDREDKHYTIDYIASKNCTTIEVINHILENKSKYLKL